MNNLIRNLLGVLPSASTGSSITESSGTETFGRYLVHYSALSTQVLNEQMAKQYAITRSPKRGLINISVQHVAADETTTAIAASISGNATNLTGQKTSIAIREIPDLYVSYIGLFDVAAPDTYTFTLAIKPDGADQAFTLRFSKNFVAE